METKHGGCLIGLGLGFGAGAIAALIFPSSNFFVAYFLTAPIMLVGSCLNMLRGSHWDWGVQLLTVALYTGYGFVLRVCDKKRKWVWLSIILLHAACFAALIVFGSGDLFRIGVG